MKLRRSKNTGRQRREPAAAPSLAQGLAYQARRSPAEGNTGRQPLREESQPKPKPKRPATLKSPEWLQRSGLIILLVAATISAINILTLSHQAKVLPLAGPASQQLLRDTSEYQEAAHKLLAGSVWNRNKITVDTGEVRRHMLTQFPELADVSITIPLLAHRPIVYVEPAQPALILTASNGNFVLDTTGKALLRVEAVSAQLHLPTVTDQTGVAATLNRRALPANDVEFIQEITAQLVAKQFTVATMAIPASSSQLDVQLAGQPYTIKFNLQRGQAREQAGTFLAMIAELAKQGILPGRYVDVRVEGRAYYQ